MNYYERIQRSLDFIEKNLQNEITLEHIARQSFFSVTHFYRIFCALVGCTVKEYIIRRRMNSAAIELSSTNKRVIDIAMDYCFESQESFIRAFKRTYGTTPGKFRKNPSNYQQIHNEIIIMNINIRKEPKLMPDFIIKRFKLVGVQNTIDHHTDFSQTIETMWRTLFEKENQLNRGCKLNQCIGYWYSTMDSNDEIVTRYLAAFEFDQLTHVPEDLTVMELPESKYAVFREKHRGEIAGYDGYAYKDWLPQSGCELNEAIPGDLEVYCGKERINPDDECEIYIPIRS